MVQVKKDHLRQAILASARMEFLRAGFRKANMRQIALSAGCSAGNLYGYFSSKRSLFFAVAEPRWAALLHTMEVIREQTGATERPVLPFDEALAYMQQLVEFFHRNRDDFLLLFCRTSGLGENPYRDKMVELQIQDIRERWEYLHKTMDHPVKQGISDFFVTRMAEDNVNTLTQFLEMDLSLEEMHRYGRELIVYDYYGFLALLKQ